MRIETASSASSIGCCTSQLPGPGRVLVLSSVGRLKREVAFKVGARVSGPPRYSVSTIASSFLAELGQRAPVPRRGSDLIGGRSTRALAR